MREPPPPRGQAFAMKKRDKESTGTLNLLVPCFFAIQAAVVASVIAEKRRGSLMSTLHVTPLLDLIG